MKEKNDRYRVIISNRAAEMLVSHAAFLAQASESAAGRLVDAFQEAANSLEILPHRCPWLAGEFIPVHTYRYLIFEKRYLMIYQVKDKTVYVDYIVDCRQDYGWLVK